MLQLLNRIEKEMWSINTDRDIGDAILALLHETGEQLEYDDHHDSSARYGKQVSMRHLSVNIYHIQVIQDAYIHIRNSLFFLSSFSLMYFTFLRFDSVGIVLLLVGRIASSRKIIILS